jgi:hypothetical protein
MRAWRAAVMTLLALTVAAAVAPSARATTDPTPLLAHYYIWFDATSWDRAKRDLPLVGRYSSDEARIMRQHVRWAKEAGIDGFIVSWKSSWRLNQRLAKLARIADAEDFKLAVTYQGLDFEREPLPVDRIAGDIDYFVDRFSALPPFNVFGKPLVIWSGTWRFTPEQIESVTAGRRGKLLILASEKNVADYVRIRPLVDGNAYYWSSVDPLRYRTFGRKLVAMSRAAHETGGLWIAPVAPGFDATMLGGSSVVRRRDGATLRERLDAATRSSPDAIGLISWNEFSENTHVEPSQRYGSRYLRVLSDARGASFDATMDLDSSEAGTVPATGIPYGTPLLIGLTSLLFVISVVVARQKRRPRPTSGGRGGGSGRGDGPRDHLVRTMSAGVLPKDDAAVARDTASSPEIGLGAGLEGARLQRPARTTSAAIDSAEPPSRAAGVTLLVVGLLAFGALRRWGWIVRSRPFGARAR